MFSSEKRHFLNAQITKAFIGIMVVRFNVLKNMLSPTDNYRSERGHPCYTKCYCGYQERNHRHNKRFCGFKKIANLLKDSVRFSSFAGRCRGNPCSYRFVYLKNMQSAIGRNILRQLQSRISLTKILCHLSGDNLSCISFDLMSFLAGYPLPSL